MSSEGYFKGCKLCADLGKLTLVRVSRACWYSSYTDEPPMEAPEKLLWRCTFAGVNCDSLRGDALREGLGLEPFGKRSVKALW